MPCSFGCRTETDGIAAGRNPPHPGAEEPGWHSSPTCRTPLPQEWGNPVYTFPNPHPRAAAAGTSTSDTRAFAASVSGSFGKPLPCPGLGESRAALPARSRRGNQVRRGLERGDGNSRVKAELEDHGLAQTFRAALWLPQRRAPPHRLPAGAQTGPRHPAAGQTNRAEPTARPAAPRSSHAIKTNTTHQSRSLERPSQATQRQPDPHTPPPEPAILCEPARERRTGLHRSLRAQGPVGQPCGTHPCSTDGLRGRCWPCSPACRRTELPGRPPCVSCLSARTEQRRAASQPRLLSGRSPDHPSHPGAQPAGTGRSLHAGLWHGAGRAEPRLRAAAPPQAVSPRLVFKCSSVRLLRARQGRP